STACGRSQGLGRTHAAGGEADDAGHRVPCCQAGRGADVERSADRGRCKAGAGADPSAPWREARADRTAMAVAERQRQHQRRLQGAQRRRRGAGQAGRAPGVARRPVAGAWRRTGAGSMKAALRIPFVVVGLLVLAWIGLTAIQVTRADALAHADPEAALRIDPDHPQALLRLAWRQLGNDQTEEAMATARHLLAVEPGQGDAFAVLALAAAKRGDTNAEALAKIALQRAPRNRDLRTQEAARAWRAGDLPAAMAQIDALLRLTPSRGKTLYPALAQQSADPAFAEALAATLSADPPWR